MPKKLIRFTISVMLLLYTKQVSARHGMPYSQLNCIKIGQKINIGGLLNELSNS